MIETYFVKCVLGEFKIGTYSFKLLVLLDLMPFSLVFLFVY